MKYIQIENIPNKMFLLKKILLVHLSTYFITIILPILYWGIYNYWIYILGLLPLFSQRLKGRNRIDYRIKISSHTITVYYYSYFWKKKETLPLNKVGVRIYLNVKEKRNSILINRNDKIFKPYFAIFFYYKNKTSNLCTRGNLIEMANMLELHKEEMLFFHRDCLPIPFM